MIRHRRYITLLWSDDTWRTVDTRVDVWPYSPQGLVGNAHPLGSIEACIKQTAKLNNSKEGRA